MIRNTTISRTLGVLMLGTIAVSAHAADDGFYIGGGAGQAAVDEGPFDDEDTALSLFGGYQFNRYLAVEGGYLDLGEIEPEVGGASLEADTLYVTAVGVLPINDLFSAYAKAGVHSWDADSALVVLGDDDSGTDATYGLGVQYRLSERFTVRGEVSRFELEDADADVAQIQVRFDF